MYTARRSFFAGALIGSAAAAIAFVSGVPSNSERAAEIELEPAAAAADRSADGLFSASLTAAAPGVSGGALADLLRLAERDVSAALAELASIEHAKLRRDAALALLDVVGNGRDGIDRVAAVLAPADRMSFVFDAIARYAAKDPRVAIELALELEGLSARTEAVIGVAKILSQRDPRGALSSATEIGNYALASAYRSAVLAVWAETDPDAFLAFIATGSASDVLAANEEAFRVAAEAHPGSLLASLQAIPSAARATAEQAALEALIRTDPGSAFTYLDSLPDGDARERLLTSTARDYALHDLEGALAWLDARRPAEAAATMAVLEVLTETDPVRGAEMLIANLTGSGGAESAGWDAIQSQSMSAQRGLELVLAAFTPGPREELSIVADRLGAVDDTAVQGAFERFLDYWSRNDAEAAHDWALVNVDRLSPGSLAFLARNLSAQRPDLAKQTASRIPPDLRTLWIRTVAEALAREDFDDALQWISGYQGQPVFETALRAGLRGGTSGGGTADPESVAQFLDRQSPRMRADSLPVIANLWGRQDPLAAALWVERVVLDPADESRRDPALANVVSQWTLRDPQGARDWMLELPRGDRRDRILEASLAVTAQDGRVDSAVVDAFSSDDARRQALLGTMSWLGRSDPELGRALIREYLDDPDERADAEERLIQGASSQAIGIDNVVIIRN